MRYPSPGETPGTSSPLGVRALLIGTGSHGGESDLPAVPAVEQTLVDLRSALVERCGLRPEAVQVLRDPPTPVEMGEAIGTVVEQATELVIFYYVGHGLVSTTGALHLAARNTDRRPTHLRHTALPYGTVREYLLESRARSCVVILDCCFSGRAAGGLGDPADEVVNLAQVAGGFVLTSAGYDEMALAPPGRVHTAFSGELLRLLTDGDPAGPSSFTWHDTYRYLSRVLPAQGFPRPRCRATGSVGDLVIALNPAYRPPVGVDTSLPSTPDDGESLADVCPYKGLAAFERADAPWFFGRERLTTALTGSLAARYDDAGPLMVVGASGAGKSSLLRAGLVPALARGALGVPGSASWPCLVFNPTADPMAALAHQVASLTGAAAEPFTDEPARLGSALRAALRQQAGDGGSAGARVVLVVDQFEEIFTQCDDEQARRAFIQALYNAAAGDGGEPSALVAIGVRADFYGQCAAYPELLSALQNHAVLVGSMSGSELRGAIERPAYAAGLRLQHGLVEVLMRDLGVEDEPSQNGTPYAAGMLPLLSHALLTTWRQRQGRVLTVAGYERTGGIRGAIAASADQVYAGLDESGQETARRLLLRLVHIGDGTDDSRRRVVHAELIADLPDPGQAAAILDAFAGEDARLVTIDRNTVEITHDALLHAWPKLRGWIDDDRAGLLVHQHLVEAARAWERDNRDPAGLYRGSRLAVAREWAQGDAGRERIGALAQAFLAAGIQLENHEQEAARRRTRRLRQMIAALVTLLLLATGTAFYALVKQRAAEEQQRLATARLLLTRAAATRATDPRTAMRLALASDRMSSTQDSRTAIAEALTESPIAASLSASSGQPRGVAYSPDGSLLAVAMGDGSVSLWNAVRPRYPEFLAVLPVGPSKPDAARNTSVSAWVSFSGDGYTLASTSGRSDVVRLWDVRDPRRPRLLTDLVDKELVPGAVAFSHTSPVLAVVDLAKTIWIWDVHDPARPQRTAVLSGDAGNVPSIAFSPTKPILAIGDNSTVRLWDLSDVRHPRRGAVRKRDFITGLAFSPDGGILASASLDRTTELWAVTGHDHVAYLKRLEGQGGWLAAVAFHPGAPLLVTTSWDRSVWLWDVSDPRHPRRTSSLKGHVSTVEAAAFGSRGNTLATVGFDGTAVLWDIGGAFRPSLTTELPPAKDQIGAVAHSPKGDLLATVADIVDKHVRLWRLRQTRRPVSLGALRLEQGVRGVALSSDGRTMATGGDPGFGAQRRTSAVRLWDISTPDHPQPVASLPGYTGSVNALEFRPDGRVLATTSAGAGVWLWDVTNRADPHRLFRSAGGILSDLAFGPDGRLLAATGGRVTTVWNVRDPRHATPMATLTSSTFSSASALAYSHDGTMLAIGGYAEASRSAQVELWAVGDLRHPALHAVLPAGVNAAVAFSRDDRTLATTGQDQAAWLWDISDPRRPARSAVLGENGGDVASIDFNPGHESIALGRLNGTTAIWNVEPALRLAGRLDGWACQAAGRGLSSDEWATEAPEVPYQATCPSGTDLAGRSTADPASGRTLWGEPAPVFTGAAFVLTLILLLHLAVSDPILTYRLVGTRTSPRGQWILIVADWVSIALVAVIVAIGPGVSRRHVGIAAPNPVWPAVTGAILVTAWVVFAVMERRPRRKNDTRRAAAPGTAEEPAKILSGGGPTRSPLTAGERRLGYALVVTAGVGGEILHHGFAIAAVVGLTPLGVVPAMLAVTAIVALGRLPMGMSRMLESAILGLIFGALYLLTESLLLPIVLSILLYIQPRR
ncbi:caspase, EACC1-associated type [Sphaerisporangium flaviroseum]